MTKITRCAATLMVLILTCCGCTCWGLIINNRQPTMYKKAREHQLPALHVGLIVPHTNFGKREYARTINKEMANINKATTAHARSRGHQIKVAFLNKYRFYQEQDKGSVKQVMFNLTPSPNAILHSLCSEFLPLNVSAILYLMNYETYGRSTASAQYFLQLAGYLGIPVIAWNADNSGLERIVRYETTNISQLMGFKTWPQTSPLFLHWQTHPHLTRDVARINSRLGSRLMRINTSSHINIDHR